MNAAPVEDPSRSRDDWKQQGSSQALQNVKEVARARQFEGTPAEAEITRE